MRAHKSYAESQMDACERNQGGICTRHLGPICAKLYTVMLLYYNSLYLERILNASVRRDKSIKVQYNKAHYSLPMCVVRCCSLHFWLALVDKQAFDRLKD